FSGRVVPLFDSMLIQQGEGSGTPTEPHHTPSQEAQPSSPTPIFTSSIPTVIPIPTVTQTKPTPLRQYTRRARIAQSSTLSPVADEPASPVRDVSKGEACHTDSDFIADQDRATIAKVKVLEDNLGVIGARSTDDAPIKGRRINEEEGITGRVSTDTEKIRIDEGEVAVKRTSEDTEELATVLTSIDAAIVLAGGIDVPTGSYSIPTAGLPTVDIHTGSEVVPTASLIVATAIVVTPYLRRKGKEVMVESDTPKKQRLQEQIDAQVARELEEKQEREDKRMTEQISRDAETQNYMHAPTEWKFYELSGVHHVTAKDKEIFMLVEKDYPLRKGLALVMISYRLQGRIVGNKMHKAFPLLVRKLPLSEGTSHCLKKNATARRKVLPLPEVCTAIIVKEKPSVKDDSFL
nr:hypothetical protein [Tanacetum cinerariifolium]